MLINNLSLIQRRWPALAALVNSVNAEPVSISQQGPISTLLVQGIHLSSCYDAVAEAQVQAQLIPDDASEAWVYGVAIGELPRSLVHRHVLKSINVVVLNTALFKALLSHVDCTDWLADTRLNLILGDEGTQVCSPFCVAPACLKLADERSALLRDRLVLALESAYINTRFQHNEFVSQQLQTNESFVAKDNGVVSLFKSGVNVDAVVLGAGPTLSDYLPLVKEYQAQGKLVVAVDAALKALLAQKIVPDFVVSIDEHPHGVKTLFAGDLSACAEVPLIYFPVVHRDVLLAWPGPRYVAYSVSPVYKTLNERYPNKGVLFASGSVFHSAVDFAVQLGCLKVHFFGADFCFPNGQTHAQDVAHTQSADDAALGDWVLNGRGERVGTARNLRGYLRDLESYIKTKPTVCFINKSVDGAKINGTVFGNE